MDILHLHVYSIPCKQISPHLTRNSYVLHFMQTNKPHLNKNFIQFYENKLASPFLNNFLSTPIPTSQKGMLYNEFL